MEKDDFVSCLAWHPNKKVLISGWKNGELLVWSENGKDIQEPPRFHKCAITTILWNSNGSKLITSDEVSFAALLLERLSSPSFKENAGKWLLLDGTNSPYKNKYK